MNRRAVFGRRALADLRENGAWIAERASDRTAARYLHRLRACCERFDIFPERGTLRGDLRPGIRIIGFERRITVAFPVFEEAVLIACLFYGGRDIESAFAEDGGDVD
ncbi:MAG TPA: type II toxin-antitoxin system RelE/ParE family toxin [Caulobacteraceae bacterium]